jgi:AcrR family transcriptional regulator
MARAGLNRETVVEEASKLVDAEGLTALTMAALAKRFGIALPSLYAHVRSLEHLRQEIALAVSNELSRRMGEAIQGYSGYDAIVALGTAYRSYAVEHPGRYAASMLIQPDFDDPRLVESAKNCGQIVYDAIRGYGLKEPALTEAARFLRASLHGFVSLEGQGGFAARRAVDPSFKSLLAAIDRALTSWPASKSKSHRESTP